MTDATYRGVLRIHGPHRKRIPLVERLKSIPITSLQKAGHLGKIRAGLDRYRRDRHSTTRWHTAVIQYLPVLRLNVIESCININDITKPINTTSKLTIYSRARTTVDSGDEDSTSATTDRTHTSRSGT